LPRVIIWSRTGAGPVHHDHRSTRLTFSFVTLRSHGWRSLDPYVSFLSTVLGRNPVCRSTGAKNSFQRPRLSPAAYKEHCTKYTTVRSDHAHFFPDLHQGSVFVSFTALCQRKDKRTIMLSASVALVSDALDPRARAMHHQPPLHAGNVPLRLRRPRQTISLMRVWSSIILCPFTKNPNQTSHPFYARKDKPT